MNDKNNKVDNKKDDFDVTMQQTFNFDSNIVDEKDVNAIYTNKKRKSATINKRINELIKIKNKFKMKYYIFLILFLLMLLFLVLMVNYHIFHPIIKEKIVVKDKLIIPENVVFLGDSITEGYNLEEYFNDINFVNSGISGDKTIDILDNMYDRLYRYNPSKVILLIGVNDLGSGKTPDEVYNNILKIISNINENRPYAKVYLESVYPINDSDDEKIVKIPVNNNEIDELNNKISTYCNKNKKVSYIDVNKQLKDNNMLKIEYTKDGLHINSAGYSKITKILSPYIKE